MPTKCTRKPAMVEAREELRKWFVRYTGGCVQSGDPKGNWPCKTCTIGFLKAIGLDPTHSDFDARNSSPDRLNEVWRAAEQMYRQLALARLASSIIQSQWPGARTVADELAAFRVKSAKSQRRELLRKSDNEEE